jgi:S-adenosylmethionine decarboxylase
MRRPHESGGNDFRYGMELIVDLDGCNPSTIADGAELRRYTSELVDLIKMKAFGEPWLQHFGHASAVTAGYTAIQPIETSSIVVHVSEGLGRVHINIFSCQTFDPEEALEYSEKFFGGTDTTFTVLTR